MPADKHRELHRSLDENIIIPRRRLLLASLGEVRKINSSSPAETVEFLADWFQRVNHPDLAANLKEQLNFLGQAAYQSSQVDSS